MAKISHKITKITKEMPCGESDDPLPRPKNSLVRGLPKMGQNDPEGFCFFREITQNIAENSYNLVNVFLLFVLMFEIMMPHRIFAFEAVNTAKNVDSMLLAEQYEFNGKYLVPEDNLINGMYEVVAAKTVATTAYSSTVDQCDADPFVAASGRRVHDGMVAANFLPFDTKIRIPEVFGDKIFIVEDRMNRRFQNRVDIWMTTRNEALKYGKRDVKIEILEEVP